MTTIRQCSMVDLAAVERVIKHPEVYPTGMYGGGVTAEDYSVSNLLSIGPPVYVLADSDNCFVAILYPLNTFTWICHDYTLPQIRGKVAATICRAMLKWMWDNTLCQKMVGFIPDNNPRARVFAQIVGFKIEGRLSKAYYSGGELHDITMVGLCKEQGNG